MRYLPLLLLLALPALADETDELIYRMQAERHHQDVLRELRAMQATPAPAPPAPQTIYIREPRQRETAPREAARCVTREEWEAGISYGPMTLDCIRRVLSQP